MASLLVGAVMALQFGLPFGARLPYELFLAPPHTLTVIVLASLGGRAHAPNALSEPYRRR